MIFSIVKLERENMLYSVRKPRSRPHRNRCETAPALIFHQVNEDTHRRPIPIPPKAGNVLKMPLVLRVSIGGLIAYHRAIGLLVCPPIK